MLAYIGMAMAARMPMIAMTIISSIRVRPRVLLIRLFQNFIMTVPLPWVNGLVTVSLAAHPVTYSWTAKECTADARLFNRKTASNPGCYDAWPALRQGPSDARSWQEVTKPVRRTAPDVSVRQRRRRALARMRRVIGVERVMLEWRRPGGRRRWPRPPAAGW